MAFKSLITLCFAEDGFWIIFERWKKGVVMLLASTACSQALRSGVIHRLNILYLFVITRQISGRSQCSIIFERKKSRNGASFLLEPDGFRWIHAGGGIPPPKRFLHRRTKRWALLRRSRIQAGFQATAGPPGESASSRSNGWPFCRASAHPLNSRCRRRYAVCHAMRWGQCP